MDLTNLREMTDGDAELEKELFVEFISSTEVLIAQMKDAIEGMDNNVWRENAHAIKGVSMNLGAEKLGQLASTAQDNHEDTADNKQQLINQIISEFALVKTFLENEMQ